MKKTATIATFRPRAEKPTKAAGRPGPVTAEAGHDALEALVADLHEETEDGGNLTDIWTNRKIEAGLRAAQALLRGESTSPSALEAAGALVMIREALDYVMKTERSETELGPWGRGKREAGLRAAHGLLSAYAEAHGLTEAKA